MWLGCFQTLLDVEKRSCGGLASVEGHVHKERRRELDESLVMISAQHRMVNKCLEYFLSAFV